MEPIKYSIVIPLYNEEGIISLLVERLQQLISEFDGPAEVIMVDDGSRDATYPLAQAVTEADPRFKLIQFSRNFGHQMAITAGMDAAAGDAVIIMDADLQDPPYVVLQMIEKWQEGYEVVYGLRQQRQGERLFKTATASMFYGLLHRIGDIDTPVDVGDFRLVDRRALNAFLQMRENNRYVRGMFSWVGFKQTGVPYTREERAVGTTHYTLRKMVKLASNGIMGFSTAPLRLATWVGVLASLLAFAFGLWVFGKALLFGDRVAGYPSLMVVILFMGGVQMLALGVIGEYLGRNYAESKQRPLYFIEEKRAPRART